MTGDTIALLGLFLMVLAEFGGGIWWAATGKNQRRVMTKQELGLHAKAFGLKVKSAFMDDWLENTTWIACGFGIGWLVGRFG